LAEVIAAEVNVLFSSLTSLAARCFIG